MKMGREVMVPITCSIMVILALVGIAEATVYTVGDSQGWTASPNITQGFYDDWAANKTFKGEFVWNGTHNVAFVTKEEYDNCTQIISVFSGGEAFQYKLPSNASGMYYFICTIDSHCAGGQKLAINVTSSETPTNDNGSSASLTMGASWAILCTGVLYHLIN
ncbi:hypothetical protein CRG98_000065 [Punica granatum]|uniref:Phytocyanin domain-containing protein n=1 Tax=Punica granatum TaxID=22663 RepID=A0A2I0LG04_PUNGR|nr:hypothetical protein CRG98_000065 [Punica granatum]